MEVVVPRLDALQAAECDTVKIFVNATQEAATVRDMVRLVVLDSVDNVHNVETQNISFCSKHQPEESAKVAGACVPISQGSRGKYLLLWGIGTEDEESDDEYEPTPLACVNVLLERHFQHELEISGDTPQKDDGMWLGGAMH
eukprot:9769239-Karenia_brevis.AAC.1